MVLKKLGGLAALLKKDWLQDTEMTSAGVEDLYKNYGLLADAGENIAQVSF